MDEESSYIGFPSQTFWCYMPGPLITESLADMVRVMHSEEQLTYKEIRAKTGISESSIKKIVNGSWHPSIYLTADLTGPLSKSKPNKGPVSRCPTCGGMVHTPCIICSRRPKEKDDTPVNKFAQFRRNESPVERTEPLCFASGLPISSARPTMETS